MIRNVDIAKEIADHGSCITTVVGYSMMPLLRQRKDIILIEKTNGRLNKYDVPLYRRANGKLVLHRILQVRDNDYIICGDNCYIKEYGITDDMIIGVLTGITRDGKFISVTDKKYILYVHLWCDFFYVRAGILRILSLARRCRKKIS